MKYTYEDIYNVMSDEYCKKSMKRINNGSEIQKKLEAVACELFALSCYGDFVFKQAFVHTATGEYLDRHGRMRDCVRKSGEKATGMLEFSVSEPAAADIIINKATICSSKNDPKIQFETIEAAKILQGKTSVQVAAQATAPGEDNNLDSNEITVMVNAPIGVEGVTNLQPFQGGFDEESDSAYRLRIMNNYGVMPSAYCKKAIENRICKLDFVADCVIQNTDKAGELYAVVKTISEMKDDDSPFDLLHAVGLPELVGAVSYFNESKVKAVDLHIDAAVKPNGDIDKTNTLIREAAQQIFFEEKIGKSIPVSRLFKAILEIDSVASCEFASRDIVGDMFACPSDTYIKLRNLEVDCYAE